MKEKLLCSILCLVSLAGLCQQDPLYSQYVLNPFIINPAYAGFSKDFSAMASYRTQWSGIEGAPETRSITGHVSLADNRMGLGLVVLQDGIGNDRNTQVIAAYGYHLLLDNNRRLSFGLRGGVMNYRQDYSSLKIDETDPGFQNNISEVAPVIGAGVIYSSDRLYAGFSVPNLLETSATTNGAEQTLYNRHGYAHLIYLLTLSHRLKLKPFALVRAVKQSPVNVDFGAMLSADDSYTLGLFSRKLHTYGALVKLNLGEVLRIGYIFEMPTNKSIGINHVTHEFTIGLRMGFLQSHDLQAVADF